MSKPVNSRSKLLGFPKSYAFIIGINHYPKINANLKSAVNDAKALAWVLKDRQGFDHVELLIDPSPEEAIPKLEKELEGIDVKLSANGAIFRDMLQRIQDPKQEPKINPQDCIVFYYAGHGKPGAFEEGPKGYLLPSDAQPEMAMLKNDSLIAMEEVFETLKKLDCHHTLLILDCCFAGKFRYADDSRMGRIGMSNMPLYPERFERYKREKAWQVIVSAGPHQTAADWLGQRQELANGVHSPFAEALLEALEGKAELHVMGKKKGDGVLTSQELFLYLWDKVERLTKDGHPGDKSQYPDLFPMANHQGGQFIFFDPNNKLNYANRTLRNPYKGLKPFETSDSDLFFGRKAVIKKLLPRLLEQPLLVITAPSGSGKSSLVKAGLFPALANWQNKKGEMPWADVDFFVLRPGAKPWTGETQEGDGKETVFTGLKALLPLLQKDKKQVLLLDQYEELFTDGASEEERTAFEAALISLHETTVGGQLKIIITLRSDYEWLLEASTFGKTFWVKEANYRFLCRIPPMGIDELREALLNPALAELYDFETDRLVASILSEVGYSQGALPMLSFTMSRFYEITNKDERIFTHQGYDKLGGINGALSQYADEVFAALGEKSKKHQEVMHKLMIRLVKANDGGFSRRRVYIAPNRSFQSDRGRSFLNEFDYSDTQDAIVLEVLEFLADKQLILGGEDFIGSYYEPVHDSLIQHWKTAKHWITDFGAENINLQRQLWQAVLDSSRSQIPQITYQALPEDGLGANDQLTSNFSKLWDANPKLLQILEQVSSAAKDYLLANKEAILTEALPQISSEDQEKFIKFFDDCHTKGQVPDLNSLILSAYSDKLLSLFFDKGNHWLNQAETNFIQLSWGKRIEDIVDIKQQRDEALALAMTSKAQTLSRSEKTTALRIAQLGWEKTLQPIPEAAYTIARIFYSQVGAPRQPLPSVEYTGHTQRVKSAVFSPNGTQILTGSDDNTAKLWDAKGRLITNFDGHTDFITSAVFSSDGTQILTASLDNTAKIWNVKGELIADLVGHTASLYSAVFSSDDAQILTASLDNTAKIWNVKGELIADLVGHTARVNSAVFSSDDSQVLTASDDHTAKLWNTKGELTTDFAGHKSRVYSAVFSPDETQVLTGSQDRTAKLWSIKGELITDFIGHKSRLYSAMFSPDGTQVLTTSYDRTAKLWTAKGELIVDFIGHEKKVYLAVFSPDGTQVLTAAKDNTAKLWNMEGVLIADFVGHTAGVYSAVFSPDGTHVLTASDDGVPKSWSIKGELMADFMGHAGGVYSAIFSPNGNRILTAAGDFVAKLWNTEGKLMADLVGHTARIYSAIFSPDGTQMLTIANDNTAKLWNKKGTLMADFMGHEGSVYSAVFSPDGSKVLTASEDNTAKLWNIKGELIANFTGHIASIYSAVFSLDGSQVLTASEDNTAKRWNIKGELITNFAGHTAGVYSALFSPDGTQVLTIAGDNTAKLWNGKGKLMANLDSHKARVNSAIFSSDGTQILTASGDFMAKLWNTKGKLITDFVGHKGSINSAVFSPDGTQILTVARDNTAKLWNATGTVIADFDGHTDKVNSAMFSSDGTHVLTASGDFTAKLWNIKGELVADIDGHTARVYSAIFSPDGTQILTAAGDFTAKLWPTPQRIYSYLKNETIISQLTVEQRKKHRIY